MSKFRRFTSRALRDADRGYFAPIDHPPTVVADVDAEAFRFRVKNAPCLYWHGGEHVVRPSDKPGELICRCGQKFLLCRVEE